MITEYGETPTLARRALAYNIKFYVLPDTTNVLAHTGPNTYFLSLRP